jgi:membrane-bound lytic murein transglycosylase A
MAQDTGGAILGAVRADYFWGWGDEALAMAGRTKQSLAMWVLWPQGAGPAGTTVSAAGNPLPR